MTDVNFIPGQGLTLAEAFELVPGEIVALVGGGGKTTTMFRLGAEVAAGGGRAVVATTTHILPPQPGECATVVMEPTLDRLLTAARRALETVRLITVSRGLIPDGRLGGISPEWVVPLQQGLGQATMLIEADGSKSRPFKAPAAHEPVIPGAATLVIPVVGLCVLGAPLDNDHVHRPELVAALAGAKLGDTITAEMLAAVIAHAEGGRRGVPPGARAVPLLNQADDEQALAQGREVARRLLARGFARVVLATARMASPVREVAVRPDRIVAVVLAAGLGQRMGRLKLGLPFDGRPLVRHVAEAALASKADEVVVVLGHEADEIKAMLPQDGRLRTVMNADYASGQSASVRTAIGTLRSEAKAVVFLLGDQPTVTAAIIDAVIEAYRVRPAAIVQPEYRGTPGHPVLFSRALFSELQAVAGDAGGREVLRRHLGVRAVVKLDCEAPGDVDTAADYAKLVGGAG